MKYLPSGSFCRRLLVIPTRNQSPRQAKVLHLASATLSKCAATQLARWPFWVCSPEHKPQLQAWDQRNRGLARVLLDSVTNTLAGWPWTTTCLSASSSSLTRQEFDIVCLSPRDVCEPVFGKPLSVEKANSRTEMCGLSGDP